jgi:hypothetical protein
MDRNIFSCGSVETPIWNVRREMPPSTSFTYIIFSVTVSASPINNAPVGPRTASNCARVAGGQPRSLPISVNVCAYPGKKIVRSLLCTVTQEADRMKTHDEFLGRMAGAAACLAVKIDQRSKSPGLATDDSDH